MKITDIDPKKVTFDKKLALSSPEFLDAASVLGVREEGEFQCGRKTVEDAGEDGIIISALP